MKPFIFDKVKKSSGYSFWLINTSNSYKYKINYALLITDDVVRIVKIDFKSKNGNTIETSFFKDIFSFSNDDDLKKLLKEFSQLEIKEFLSIENLYDFIDYIKQETKENNKVQKQQKQINQISEKFLLFMVVIYEYIYNRELKYSMPLWFRNSFIVKAITLKLKYKLYLYGSGLDRKKSGDDFKEVCKNWINFCLDNWNINLNYPPILENFPEGEIKGVLNNKNILIWLKEDKEWKDVIKRTLTFFLKRYDIKNVITNLIVYCMPSAYKLSNSLFCLLVAIILFLITLPLYRSILVNVSLVFLFVVLLILYVFFFAITQKIFFPRALFGSTVAWIILSSVPEVRNLPEKLLINCDKSFSFCSEFVSIIFIFLFIVIVIIYIISEMETFIKEIPMREKVGRAFTLLIFIYSIAFIIGYIFAYDFITSNRSKDLLKYYYLASIATFISIAAQIMWEDKPITEV